jgi:hypothetical protein
MLALLLATRMALGTAMAACSCTSNSELELSCSPAVSASGGQLRVQLRWRSVPNLWQLKRTEMVYIGRCGLNEKALPNEWELPAAFRNQERASVSIQLDIPKHAKVGDRICVQCGAMRVHSFVVP